MTTVIWIDWYSYHVSRFRALVDNDRLRGRVTGIELVGGCGVHRGLKFRDNNRQGLPIRSLLPDADWDRASQWRLARRLWCQLDDLQPSTVLVPGYYTLPALAAACWARVNRKRSVLMSETTRFDHSRSMPRELIKKALARLLFDYGIAGGKPHARYLRELGFKSDKIGRFYDVVDNDYYMRASDGARRRPEAFRELRLPPNYFLYVGRLSPEKNIDGLIREYVRYVARGGTWQLVLVGDGPQRAELERLAHESDVADRIRFEGLRNTHETIPYYSFANCFVLPSTREPWGLVVNEAMAASLPVLVSDRCGCAEDLVSEGVNGFIVNPQQPGEMAGMFTHMESISVDARNQMGAASRRIVSAYSPQHWADEVARISNA